MSDWPRVTHILQAAGLGPDYSMVPPAILHQARMRGIATHAAIEAAHYGYLEEAELPEDCMPYVAAYRAFVKESGHTAVLSEFRVESAQWRYCGHPDRLGWLCGKRALIDFKTGPVLARRAVARQLAGYRIALEEQRPHERIDITAALQLRGDGTYRLEDVDSRGEAASEFLAAVVVYHARQEDAA